MEGILYRKKPKIELENNCNEIAGVEQEKMQDLKSLEKESSLKEGVDFVFEQNPELANIGTPEEYCTYIDTIFPESEVKNILYHGTFQKFDSFDKNLIGQNTDSKLIDYYGQGFYLSQDKNIHHNWGRPYKIACVVNYSSENETKDNYITNQYAVIEKPENIHILGSSSDIQKFKEYINSQKSPHL